MNKYENLINDLRSLNIQFDNGLSDEEIAKIELLYGIRFPLSLKEMYQKALPVSRSFYNWRDFNKSNIDKIQNMLNWPLDGILFDVENNVFWHKSWGLKPPNFFEAKQKCIEEMKKVPRLIPVFGHRYIPVIDDVDDPPILSVYQTDIIYCGINLENYFRHEFMLPPFDGIIQDKLIPIPFWSEL